MATLLAHADASLQLPFAAETKRAKLAILLFDLAATGVTRNALMLSAYLAETADVTLLVVSRNGVLAPLVDPRVHVVALAQPKRRPGLSHLLFAAQRLRVFLRKEAPEMLLSVGNRTHLVASLAGKVGLQTAMVFRLSNSLEHKGGRSGAFGRLRRALSLRLIASSATELLAVSPSVAREAAALGKPVRTIRNGVDVAAVRARSREPVPPHVYLPLDIPWALSVGRLVEQKNHEAAVDALAVANRTTPMALVILGEGSDKARAALRARARRLGVDDRLFIIGTVDNPFPIMRRASVFLMTSLWEGCSNALLEAMACGLPIVASDRAGDAANLLGFGRYGLLVDAANPDDVAAALLTQMGERAVLPGRRIEAFDISVTLRNYADLLV
ncbi:glycosyltransferase [Sphingomonas sp.]|uniref:glycosyltransferase n=1 Tax=Sphingomonas sp. TaxID=28214 RepID=UPI003B3AAEE6